MRTPSSATTSPWGSPEIDNGWKDLVVSSAPPPPPREALEPVPARNPTLPADFHTWQEHGSRIAAAAVQPAVEEPNNFTAGDRRLWIVAGTLMALATLVLGLLGLLTFGGAVSSAAPSAEAARAASVEPARAVTPSRAVEPSRAVAPAKVQNPRHLTAKATKHGRHHKRTLSAER